METIIKFSFPKMTSQNDRQDENLAGQVHNQAGHSVDQTLFSALPWSFQSSLVIPGHPSHPSHPSHP